MKTVTITESYKSTLTTTVTTSDKLNTADMKAVIGSVAYAEGHRWNRMSTWKKAKTEQILGDYDLENFSKEYTTFSWEYEDGTVVEKFASRITFDYGVNKNRMCVVRYDDGNSPLVSAGE